MRIKIVLMLCLLLTFFSCEQNQTNLLEGLWLVEKVEMGNESMTPISRWMRFNADNTQTSGNGWLQHSYGNWILEENQLTVEDINGVKDITAPFTIELKGDKMIWIREEDGQEVKVSLKRIQELPQSEGNKLIGLWNLQEFIDNGNNINAVVDPDGKSMLHLRWDNTYVQHNMPKGKKFGIYKIHAHKNEIQMVNYGNESIFSFWKFKVKEDVLELTSTDKTSKITLTRIHKYIE